jgi:hypothetical protein
MSNTTTVAELAKVGDALAAAGVHEAAPGDVARVQRQEREGYGDCRRIHKIDPDRGAATRAMRFVWQQTLRGDHGPGARKNR